MARPSIDPDVRRTVFQAAGPGEGIAPHPGLGPAAPLERRDGPAAWPQVQTSSCGGGETNTSRSVFPTVTVTVHEPAGVERRSSRLTAALPRPTGRHRATRDTGSRAFTGIAAACIGLGALFAVVAIARHGHAVQVGGGSQSSALAPLIGRHVSTPVGRPGPIDLPPPGGDAPRTQPLLTEWVVDADLLGSRQFVATFDSEAPLVVAYIARNGLPSDRLGFGFLDPGEPVQTNQMLLAAEVGDPATIVVQRPGGLINLPRARPGQDRAIVILTDDPAAWSQDIPSGPVPALPPARRHAPMTRWFVIGVETGGGPQADPAITGSDEPQTLVVDDSARGDMARALARVFVDATGGSWS
jgi:hypothetical protein